mmetsp:Transcript_21960/g.43884  ORF Transcript_21960/g.43884 Transcript_21960/m.43884 type:complete len:207 (-) Transcript_21960:762-1382(-)
MFSRRAISSTAMEALRSLTMPSREMSLYFSKFSGETSFLISESGDPLSLISVSMRANFSLAWMVTRVSGMTMSIFSARALSMAAFLTPTNSRASSASTASLISSMSFSTFIPGRMLLANSSSISGRVRVSTESTVTSKMAVLPARVLSLRPMGKVTVTSRVSLIWAPTRPSTRPSMYLPVSMTTSTWSPEAALGKGSPLAPASVAM